MLNNHLSENGYMWHERNVWSVIETVTGRPSLDWRIREDFLEEGTGEWVQVKDKRHGDYIEMIQICEFRFIGGTSKGNDGGGIFVEMKAGN